MFAFGALVMEFCKLANPASSHVRAGSAEDDINRMHRSLGFRLGRTFRFMLYAVTSILEHSGTLSSWPEQAYSFQVA